VKHGKISVKAGKGVFHMNPGHVLEKNTRNLYTFFSFLSQQKIRPHCRLYGRLCRTRIFVTGRVPLCPIMALDDVNRMDKKQLYTCLSRTTKYEYIHLDSHELNYCYRIREQPRLELVNSHFNSVYLKGKIYKITLEKCDKVYIGSTCEELETRLKWHVSNNTSQVFKNKRYNPKIELVVKAGNCLKEWRISGYTNMLQIWQ